MSAALPAARWVCNVWEARAELKPRRQATEGEWETVRLGEEETRSSAVHLPVWPHREGAGGTRGHREASSTSQAGYKGGNLELFGRD